MNIVQNKHSTKAEYIYSFIKNHPVLLYNCSIDIWAEPPPADALAQPATDCTSG